MNEMLACHDGIRHGTMVAVIQQLGWSGSTQTETGTRERKGERQDRKKETGKTERETQRQTKEMD